MKDYTFGNEEYKKRFILNYTEEENGRYLVAHLADGSKEIYENNESNENALLSRMGMQIEIAEEKIHKETIDYSKTNLFVYLKMYWMVQSKIKDLEKNRLILENPEYIPITLKEADQYTLHEIQTMLYLDHSSIENNPFLKRKLTKKEQKKI